MSQKVIYKYRIQPGGSVCVLPEDYRVLSAGVQNDTNTGGTSVVVWVEHDVPGVVARHVAVTFNAVPTGVGYEGGQFGEYVDTIEMYNGSLVFHIFSKDSE